MNHGIAYIPEDRNKDGLVGDMSVWENSVMTETNRIDISNKFGWMNEANCLNQANDICDVFDVRTQSIFQPARLLSGGNVQKLLIFSNFVNHFWTGEGLSRHVRTCSDHVGLLGGFKASWTSTFQKQGNRSLVCHSQHATVTTFVDV